MSTTADTPTVEEIVDHTFDLMADQLDVATIPLVELIQVRVHTLTKRNDATRVDAAQDLQELSRVLHLVEQVRDGLLTRAETADGIRRAREYRARVAFHAEQDGGQS